MNRRVETIKLENAYLTKVWSETAPEAYAVECAAQSVPPASAFRPKAEQPNPGEAFDPEEKWPSDDRATWYHGPINCDGHNAGTVLAQAQHGAADDGDDCTGVACLLTRGAND